MIDILNIENGDMSYADTNLTKAKNLISTQIGGLEYLKDWGVDLEYFLVQDLNFSVQSLKAYLVQELAKKQITLTDLTDVLNVFEAVFDFNLRSN